MTIREKIKEIVENIDKFKLNLNVQTRIWYENIEIINSEDLYIYETQIHLVKEEREYLKEYASKRFLVVKKEIENQESKKQNDLLNSINFNK